MRRASLHGSLSNSTDAHYEIERLKAEIAYSRADVEDAYSSIEDLKRENESLKSQLQVMEQNTSSSQFEIFNNFSEVISDTYLLNAFIDFSNKNEDRFNKKELTNEFIKQILHENQEIINSMLKILRPDDYYQQQYSIYDYAHEHNSELNTLDELLAVFKRMRLEVLEEHESLMFDKNNIYRISDIDELKKSPYESVQSYKEDKIASISNEIKNIIDLIKSKSDQIEFKYNEEDLDNILNSDPNINENDIDYVKSVISNMISIIHDLFESMKKENVLKMLEDIQWIFIIKDTQYMLPDPNYDKTRDYIKRITGFDVFDSNDRDLFQYYLPGKSQDEINELLLKADSTLTEIYENLDKNTHTIEHFNVYQSSTYENITRMFNLSNETIEKLKSLFNFELHLKKIMDMDKLIQQLLNLMKIRNDLWSEIKLSEELKNDMNQRFETRIANEKRNQEEEDEAEYNNALREKEKEYNLQIQTERKEHETAVNDLKSTLEKERKAHALNIEQERKKHALNIEQERKKHEEEINHINSINDLIHEIIEMASRKKVDLHGYPYLNDNSDGSNVMDTLVGNLFILCDCDTYNTIKIIQNFSAELSNGSKNHHKEIFGYLYDKCVSIFLNKLQQIQLSISRENNILGDEKINIELNENNKENNKQELLSEFNELFYGERTLKGFFEFFAKNLKEKIKGIEFAYSADSKYYTLFKDHSEKILNMNLIKRLIKYSKTCIFDHIIHAIHIFIVYLFYNKLLAYFNASSKEEKKVKLVELAESGFIILSECISMKILEHYVKKIEKIEDKSELFDRHMKFKEINNDGKVFLAFDHIRNELTEIFSQNVAQYTIIEIRWHDDKPQYVDKISFEKRMLLACKKIVIDSLADFCFNVINSIPDPNNFLGGGTFNVDKIKSNMSKTLSIEVFTFDGDYDHFEQFADKICSAIDNIVQAGVEIEEDSLVNELKQNDGEALVYAAYSKIQALLEKFKNYEPNTEFIIKLSPDIIRTCMLLAICTNFVAYLKDKQTSYDGNEFFGNNNYTFKLPNLSESSNLPKRSKYSKRSKYPNLPKRSKSSNLPKSDTTNQVTKQDVYNILAKILEKINLENETRDTDNAYYKMLVLGMFLVIYKADLNALFNSEFMNKYDNNNNKTITAIINHYLDKHIAKYNLGNRDNVKKIIAMVIKDVNKMDKDCCENYVHTIKILFSRKEAIPKKYISPFIEFVNDLESEKIIDIAVNIDSLHNITDEKYNRETYKTLSYFEFIDKLQSLKLDTDYIHLSYIYEVFNNEYNGILKRSTQLQSITDKQIAKIELAEDGKSASDKLGLHLFNIFKEDLPFYNNMNKYFLQGGGRIHYKDIINEIINSVLHQSKPKIYGGSDPEEIFIAKSNAKSPSLVVMSLFIKILFGFLTIFIIGLIVYAIYKFTTNNSCSKQTKIIHKSSNYI